MGDCIKVRWASVRLAENITFHISQSDSYQKSKLRRLVRDLGVSCHYIFYWSFAYDVIRNMIK